jgi:cell division protein FtsQ
MIGDDRRTAPRRERTNTATRRAAAGRRSTRSWRLLRSRRALRRRRLPRPGPRSLAAFAAVLALAAGAWFWLRTSSLVAVRRVQIAGVSGPDASQIRSALTSAAHEMTTLDVKMSALRTAVAPYPVVKNLQVSTGFPHDMRIQVSEEVPVAEIASAGHQQVVSSDGTLLHDAAWTGPLPTIQVPVAPGGSRVDGQTLSEVQLLAAAPYGLLAKLQQVTSDSMHGLTAELRNGPKIYFGDDTQLAAKWSAAVAVLAAGSYSAGSDYIDVTYPARPAAGVGSDSGASAPAGVLPSAGQAGSSGNTGAGASGNSGAGASGNTGAVPTGNTGVGATGNTGVGATGNTGAGPDAASGNTGTGVGTASGNTGAGAGNSGPGTTPAP